MRLDLVKLFVISTSETLEELVGPSIEIESMRMQASPDTSGEVTAIISLTGDAYGKVMIEMNLGTALGLAGRLLGEDSRELTPLVRSSIAELGSMAIGRAISFINDAGTRVGMRPPVVMTRAGAPGYDDRFETLVATIKTVYGEIGLNVTLQSLV